MSALNSESPYLRTAAARITNSPFDSQAGIESDVPVPRPNTGPPPAKPLVGAGRLLLGAERRRGRRLDGIPDARAQSS